MNAPDMRLLVPVCYQQLGRRTLPVVIREDRLEGVFWHRAVWSDGRMFFYETPGRVVCGVVYLDAHHPEVRSALGGGLCKVHQNATFPEDGVSWAHALEDDLMEERVQIPWDEDNPPTFLYGREGTAPEGSLKDALAIAWAAQRDPRICWELP